MTSATCGTTALPRLRSRSTRAGTPSTTRQTSGSTCHQARLRRSDRERGVRQTSLPSLAWLPACRRFSSPSPSASATTNSRRLRWGAPTSAAERWNHSASYPARAMSVIARPSPPGTANPGTSSTSTNLGRRCRHNRQNAGQRSRSSSCPLRFPATLHGWHGTPPQMRSTGSRPASTEVLMSSWRRMLGQCFASTFRQNGSRSTCHATRIPARSRPRSSPPIPAKQLPTVRLTSALRSRHPARRSPNPR